MVAGSLLITSIIAGIFLLGLRDTVSLTSSTFSHLVLQIRANPKGWFIFAMVLQIPIFGIVLAISCCNEKVENKKRLNATFHVMLRWAGGIHSTSS